MVMTDADLRRVTRSSRRWPGWSRLRCRSIETAITTSTRWPTRLPTPASWCCAGPTIRAAPSNPPSEVRRFLRRVPRTPSCCSTRPISSSSRASTHSTPRIWCADSPMSLWCGRFRRPTGWQECAPATASARPIWPERCGGCSYRSAPASTSLAAVAASYAAEANYESASRSSPPSGDYLRTRLRARGIDSTDSHANFVYLPPNGRPWQEAFDGTGLQVRSYGDGGVRITVGNRRPARPCWQASGKSRQRGVSDGRPSMARSGLSPRFRLVHTVGAWYDSEAYFRRKRQARQALWHGRSRVSAKCCSRRDPSAFREFLRIPDIGRSPRRCPIRSNRLSGLDRSFCSPAPPPDGNARCSCRALTASASAATHV